MKRHLICLLSVGIFWKQNTWAQHHSAPKAPGIETPATPNGNIKEHSFKFRLDSVVGQEGCQKQLSALVQAFNEASEAMAKSGKVPRVRVFDFNCKHLKRKWLSEGGASEVELTFKSEGLDCSLESATHFYAIPFVQPKGSGSSDQAGRFFFHMGLSKMVMQNVTPAANFILLPGCK